VSKVVPKVYLVNFSDFFIQNIAFRYHEKNLQSHVCLKGRFEKKEFSKIWTSEKVLRSMWPWPLEGLIIDAC